MVQLNTLLEILFLPFTPPFQPCRLPLLIRCSVTTTLPLPITDHWFLRKSI
jgi:hypothetical protein